jgi:hypothetical protein
MSDTFKTELPYHHQSSTTSNTSLHSHGEKLPPTSSLISHSPSLSSSHLSSSSSSSSIRLPPSVNLVALREAFLSEAPFVTNNTRMFWRRMVDNINYQNLLAISYHIICDCISSENSIIDLNKLYNLHSLIYIQNLSSNLAEMYYSIKLRDREILFSRLSEVLSFMIVSALRTSIPKHHRICQSVRFREILLDWYGEVLNGIRTTNCHVNREWFFQDIYDIPILTTNTPTVTTPGGSMGATTHHFPPGSTHPTTHSSSSATAASSSSHGIIRSKYTISLSPLINLYTGNSLAKKSEVSLSLSLSHSTTRPLTSLPTLEESRPHTNATHTNHTNTNSGITMGRLKGKSLDYAQIKLLLQLSKERRKKILSDHRNGVKEANKDIAKYKARYKKTLKALEQTNKESILAMHSTAPSGGVGVGGVSAGGGGGGGTGGNATPSLGTSPGVGGIEPSSLL